MTSLAQSKQELIDFYQNNFDRNLKRLNDECDRLKTWFARDFPESDLRLIVDVDNICRTFTITLRVLMGEEMVQNRGFFENKVVLREKDIINPSFMDAFFLHFGHAYREEIQRAVNNHYRMEKAREAVV